MALMLGACEKPPQVEGLKSLGTTTGTLSREPTKEPEISVYGSGEEAESAGKPERRTRLPECDGLQRLEWRRGSM